MTKKLPFDIRDVGLFLIVVYRDNVRLTVTPSLPLFAGLDVIKRPQFLRREVVEEVIGDASRLGITADERYKNYLAKAKATKFGRWLFKNNDFLAAYDILKKKGMASPKSPYAAQHSELGLLNCAGISGFFALRITGGEHALKSASAKENEQGIARAKNLKRSLAAGVTTGSFTKDEQLKALLDEFIANLGTKPRKKRNDKTALQREFVKTISIMLLKAYGEISPTIVKKLAGMVEYRPTGPGIKNQIRTLRIQTGIKK